MNNIVESPCINVCELNKDNLCTGCYRTIDEIGQWSQMSYRQQQETLKKSQQRQQSKIANR